MDAINKTDFTPENQFILIGCRSSLAAPDFAELMRLLEISIDWDTVYSLATYHGIAPIIYRNLQPIWSVSSKIPILQKLRDTYYATLCNNAILYQELEHVLQVLQKEGIETLLLKGVYLAEAIYGDIGLRPMADIDLLVSKDVIDVVAVKMSTLGYVEEFQSKDHNLHFGYDLPYVHKDDFRRRIEIHWSPTSAEVRKGKVFLDDIWKDARCERIANIRVKVMSSEHLLTHLSMHLCSTKHGFDRLLWLCDISKVIAEKSDSISWDSLIDKASKYETRTAMYFTFVLAKKLLGAKIPGEVIERLRVPRWRKTLFYLVLGKEPVMDGVPDYRKSALNYLTTEKFSDSGKLLKEKLFPASNSYNYYYKKEKQYARFLFQVENAVAVVIRGIKNSIRILLGMLSWVVLK